MRVLPLGLLVFSIGLARPVWAGPPEIVDPAEKATLGQAIRDSGLPCPQVALAYDLGQTPAGEEIKVYCGSVDGGIDAKLLYKVVVANGQLEASPWQEAM